MKLRQGTSQFIATSRLPGVHAKQFAYVLSEVQRLLAVLMYWWFYSTNLKMIMTDYYLKSHTATDGVHSKVRC